MTIETARGFFLWCSVINYGVLLLWALFASIGGEKLYRLWSPLFPISREVFTAINLFGMTLYKTGIILFNIVPCIVLYIIG